MTMLSNIGAIPLESAAPSSALPPAASLHVRSTALAKSQSGSGISADPAKGGNPAEPDRASIDRAIEEVKKIVEPSARNLLFSVDQDSGKIVVKIVDASSKEVIRQIPSKEMLAIANALKALDKSGSDKPPLGMLLQGKV